MWLVKRSATGSSSGAAIFNAITASEVRQPRS
jgi:hypothetical protein